MNIDDLQLCMKVAATLLVAATGLVVLGELVQRWAKSIEFKVMFWRSCCAALILFAGFEISGVTQLAARTWPGFAHRPDDIDKGGAQVSDNLSVERNDEFPATTGESSIDTWGDALASQMFSGIESFEHSDGSSDVTSANDWDPDVQGEPFNEPLMSESHSDEPRLDSDSLRVSSAASSEKLLGWQGAFLTFVVFWSSVSGVLIVLLLWQHGRQIWFCRRANQATEDQVEQCRQINKQLNASHGRHDLNRGQICVSDRIASPAVCGLWRPKLILPASFESDWNAEQREVILLHELAHVANRDPLWQFLVNLVCCCMWIHPGVWILRSRLSWLGEIRADEATLCKDDGARILAECLLDLGRRFQRPPSFALGVRGRLRSGLGKRVEHLLRLADDDKAGPPHRSKHWKLRLVTASVLVVMLGSSAWAQRHSFSEEGTEKMGTRSVWKQSVVWLALTVATTSLNAQDAERAKAEKKRRADVAEQEEQIKKLKDEKAQLEQYKRELMKLRDQLAKERAEARKAAERAAVEADRARAAEKKAIEQAKRNQDLAKRRVYSYQRQLEADAVAKKNQAQDRAKKAEAERASQRLNVFRRYSSAQKQLAESVAKEKAAKNQAAQQRSILERQLYSQRAQQVQQAAKNAATARRSSSTSRYWSSSEQYNKTRQMQEAIVALQRAGLRDEAARVQKQLTEYVQAQAKKGAALRSTATNSKVQSELNKMKSDIAKLQDQVSEIKQLLEKKLK